MVTNDKHWLTFKVLRLLTTQNGSNSSKYASNFQTPSMFLCTPSASLLYPIYAPPCHFCTPSMLLYTPSALFQVPLYLPHPSHVPLCPFHTHSMHPRRNLISQWSLPQPMRLVWYNNFIYIKCWFFPPPLKNVYMQPK